MKSKKIPSPLEEITIDNRELPEGWEEAPLLELCELIRGVSYTKGEESHTSGKGFVPLLRANNIDRKLKFDDIYYVPERFVKLKQYLQQGDALVAMSSGSKSIVGKAATVRQPFDGTFGAFCGVLRPSKRVDWKFFGYFFQTKYYRDRISEASAGVNINNLKREYFEAINFPLPPLDEQQRIVVRVEALLTHVNAARDRLIRVPLIMKQFRQAVLVAACSGRLTEGWREENPDVEPADDALLRCIQIATTQKSSRKIRRRGTVGMPEIDLPEDLPNTWTIKKIKELVEIGAVTDYQDGNHGELYPRTTDFGDNGIKFLTATQVFDNEVRLSEAPLLKKEKASQLRIGFAKPRDVLLTHNATVGRVALMPDNCGEIILGTSVTYYRLNPEFVDPNYCCYIMQGKFWQSQLWAIMEQTTRNQVSITKQAEFYFPLPPLAEQHEIVRRVGLLFERADAFDQEVVAAGRRCERLTQAVLGKAFAGKL